MTQPQSSPDAARSTPARTVIGLRSRWKPTKQRLVAAGTHEAIRIRIHRACSWLHRVEQIEAADPVAHADDALILRWVAFNSLYGRWDEQQRQPQPDFESVRDFVAQILPLDHDGHLDTLLADRRDAVMAIFEDGYIDKYFWKDPGEQALIKAERAKFRAQGWYVEGRQSLLLNGLLQRIYTLRCQLVHGAASRGGALNRESVQRCNEMLAEVVPTFLVVLIDHGWSEEWGALCFPPIR